MEGKKEVKETAIDTEAYPYLDTMGTIYTKTIENRLRTYIEPQFSSSQMGFRKNRGCTDAL